MRVAALLGVEGAAQHFHGVEVILRKLLGHEINFLGADAVFAGDAAAERDALFQNVMAGRQRALHFAGVAFIV